MLSLVWVATTGKRLSGWANEALDSAASLAPDAGAESRREAARAIAEALNTKAVALARLGRSREAVREIEKSVEAAENAGLLSAACRGYTNLGVLYTTIDPTRAIAVCRRGLEVARRIGDLGFQARLLANLAVASCTFTDRCPEEGVPAAEKAIEIDRALDQREHLAVPLTVLAQIHQCHDAPELARRYYHEALEVAGETGEPQLLFPCYDGLATLCLDRDEMAEAERYFGMAQALCERHGIDPSEEGGRIDVDIIRRGERCVIRVTDTGVGVQPSANGLGTGLTTLRERLRLIFGDAAHLRLTPNGSRGTVAEIDMPALA